MVNVPLGRTQAGKTTLMYLMAGLDRPTEAGTDQRSRRGWRISARCSTRNNEQWLEWQSRFDAGRLSARFAWRNTNSGYIS